MKLTEHIGLKIKGLRKEKNLSQAELADSLGVATNTVSRWETGTYKPGVEDLEAISRSLEVSILTLLPEERIKGSDKLKALLRAADGLPEGDIDELRRYAEYRRARASMK